MLKLKYLRDLPFVIPTKQQQKQISEKAKTMIKLYQDLHSTPANSDKWEKIKKEIEKTDKEIDKKVYELYGLTEDEIKIVEEN